LDQLRLAGATGLPFRIDGFGVSFELDSAVGAFPNVLVVNCIGMLGGDVDATVLKSFGTFGSPGRI
jgi:hypothetical protein